MCVHINIYMYIQFIYIHPIEIRIYICVEINYEESTHAMMKAVKSRNLPCASWRKVGDVVLVQVQRPPNQGSQWCTSHFKRGQEKADSPIQSGRQKAKGVNSSFLHLFVPLRSSTDWRMPTTLGKASYFTGSTSSNTILTQKHPHRHSDVVFIPSTLWDFQGGA